MINLKALAIKIKFSEAFFKVHYTKASRLTYPIPLPTSVAGMFGSMLGLQRKACGEQFKEYLFGAAVVSGTQINIQTENCSYMLLTKKERGVERISILNSPEYYIVIAGKEVGISNYYNKITSEIKYLPFGGQNDFFPLDWKIIGLTEVTKKTKVSGYVPTNWVSSIHQDTKLEILPVAHNISTISESFTFILSGAVEIREQIPCAIVNTVSVPLYSLEQFVLVGEWKS